MPQMNKGGKFVFGKSNIQESGKIQFPIQAMSEYQITAEGKVYLFTGSKVTGGFCVTRKGLLLPSKLGHILAALPELQDYTAEEGAFLPYAGARFQLQDRHPRYRAAVFWQGRGSPRNAVPEKSSHPHKLRHGESHE